MFIDSHGNESVGREKMSAAGKAGVCDNKIEVWQVYCDAKILFDTIDKNK